MTTSPQRKPKPHFLITGTGRSGTLFMSTALTFAGVKTGHENVYRNDAEQHEWKDNAGDSSWLAIPLIESGVARPPETVIHITRHPSRAIASRYEVGLSPELDHPSLELWRPDLCHPEDPDVTMNPVQRFKWACDLWCALIDEAEKLSVATYKLEDVHKYEVATELLETIGHENADPSPFWRVRETVNHSREWHRERWILPGGAFPWCTLPKQVRSRASRLGYGEYL